MLVLKTLSVQSLHAYGIAQSLQRLSHDVIRVEEGSLYPALQRMRQTIDHSSVRYNERFDTGLVHAVGLAPRTVLVPMRPGVVVLRAELGNHSAEARIYVERRN